MNKDTYQSQVYNLGSPHPTARRNLADSFPLNKSLNSGSGTKRKFSPDEDTETQRIKMVKVGDMEMEDLIKALQGAF